MIILIFVFSTTKLSLTKNSLSHQNKKFISKIYSAASSYAAHLPNICKPKVHGFFAS